jgi:Ca2+-binding EF-hand superfamily protein
VAERACIQAFQKYDMDVSGKMNFSELKSMLTDLNQGEVPDDAEVQVLERGQILMRNHATTVFIGRDS